MADAGIVNVFVTVVACPCASVLVSTSVDVTLALPADVCSAEEVAVLSALERVRVMEEGRVRVFVMVVAFPWASVVVSTSVVTSPAAALLAVDEEAPVRVRPPPEMVQVFVMVVALPLLSEVTMVCTSSLALLVKVCVMVMVRPLTTEVAVAVAQAVRVIDEGTVKVRVTVLPEASVLVTSVRVYPAGMVKVRVMVLPDASVVVSTSVAALLLVLLC